MRISILVTLIALALTDSTAAKACAWSPPVNIGDAAFADLVFEGRLTDYTQFSSAEQPDFVTHVTATFAVVSVLKGEPEAEVTLVMLFKMVPFPEPVELTDTVFVATVSRDEDHNPRPDLPILLHPTCGTGFLVPATGENRAAILAAIAAP